MTKKQRNVFLFIKNFIEENGYSPSVREIGKGVNKAISTVHVHLLNLEQQGYIKSPIGKHRGIEILKVEEVIK